MNLTFVSQRVQRGHCVHWQTAAELENICQHRRLQRKASSQVVWTLQKAACRRQPAEGPCLGTRTGKPDLSASRAILQKGDIS